jgi:hypothetical protein
MRVARERRGWISITLIGCSRPGENRPEPVHGG